jgi:hypothetical protein
MRIGLAERERQGNFSECRQIVRRIDGSILSLRIPCENRVASPFHGLIQEPEEAISGVTSVIHKPPYIEIAFFIGGRDDPDNDKCRDCFRGHPFLSVRFLLGEQKKVNNYHLFHDNLHLERCSFFCLDTK